MFMELLVGLTKSFFNAMGFDLIRTSKLSQFNLCGLKNMSIKTIIDVGANTGQFARSMIAHFPEARFWLRTFALILCYIASLGKRRRNRELI